MAGLIGKKLGMTSMFDDNGKSIACTVVKAGPCVATQIRTVGNDGYQAVQLAFDEKKEKQTTKALNGHFSKAKTTPKRKLVEFKKFNDEIQLGETVTVDIFDEGEWVDVGGTSIGKGFQGVVKRHGFHGVGGQTHGQHNRNRSPGSIGAASYPARVFKGMKMGGRLGGKKAKIINLKILKIVSEENLLIIKGAVPGPTGAYVIVEK